jgi:cobalt-zinc-cadmium efflux system outer membrane protein
VALAAEAKAQTALRLRFPQVPQDARALPDPVPPEFDEAQWLERILATHPLLLSAQQALRKAELGSARTQAERTPDPTVGVFTSSEARRTERVVGLSFSIPFGGTYREQSARVALQEVEVARLGVARQRRDLALQVATQVQEAVSNVAQWRLTEHSASLLRETARLTQRAYGLGEADLQTLLLVKRQSLEATSAAAAMKADALRARYRLLVDAGMLWDLGGAQP